MRIPYFVFGIVFILTGVFEIIRKHKSNKDLFWKDYLSEKTLRIIGLIFGVVFILLGSYLVIKGIFNPFSKEIGFTPNMDKGMIYWG